MHLVLRRKGYMEALFLYPHLFARRAKIDFSGKDFQSIGYLPDIDIRSSLTRELGKKALVLGRKMLHKDDHKTELFWQSRKKTLKSVQAAG